jgi:hypothetical protein
MNKAVHAALILSIIAAVTNPVHAAAVDHVQLTISKTTCDGSIPADMSTVIYATNQGSEPLIVSLQYDSKPGGQIFALFDSSLAPLQDHFPKTEQRLLAPGQKLAVGCTVNYRADPNGGSYNPIDVVVTIKGTQHVDSAAAANSVPEEQPQQFAAFILQPDVPACGSGAHPAGLLYLVNLHPFKSLNGTIMHAGGKTNDFKLPPLGFIRAGCSNGDAAVGSISHLEFAEAAAAQ